MLQTSIKDQKFPQNPVDTQIKEIPCKGPLVKGHLMLEKAIAILYQPHLVCL